MTACPSALYKGDNPLAANIAVGDYFDLLARFCCCGAPLQVTQQDDGDHLVVCKACRYEFRTDGDGLVTDPPRAAQS
jgi:hypothetical protein